MRKFIVGALLSVVMFMHFVNAEEITKEVTLEKGKSEVTSTVTIPAVPGYTGGLVLWAVTNNEGSKEALTYTLSHNNQVIDKGDIQPSDSKNGAWLAIVDPKVMEECNRTHPGQCIGPGELSMKLQSTTGGCAGEGLLLVQDYSSFSKMKIS